MQPGRAVTDLAPPRARAGRSRETRWRRLLAETDARFVLVVFLAGRVLISALALLGFQLDVRPADVASGWVVHEPSSDWHAAFTGLERYDAQWYLQIARDGYEPGDPSSAYFPAYPLLVRGVALVLGERWLLAATIVSNAALLLALLALARLTRRELSRRTSRWSLVLLVLSPVGFFLYAPYTESLFLLLAVLCLTWLRSERWWWAAAAAGLATATRSTGVVLVAAMGLQALQQAGWWPRGAQAWRTLAARLGASVAGLAGLVAYLGWWQAQSSFREPTDALTTGFARELHAPWTTVWNGLRETTDQLADPIRLPYTIESILGLAAFALAVVAVRRYALPYGVFVVGSMLLPLFMAIPGSSLTSVARYDLVVFPLFWALAEVTRRPLVRGLTVASSLLLLCTLTLLFVAWHPVL